jgi:hypothetical protein
MSRRRRAKVCGVTRVPQFDRPQPRLVGVGLDREGQVALLVAQADLVLGGRGQDLRRPEVRAPDLGRGPGQEGVDDLAATAGGDDVVAGLGRLEDPLPAIAPGHPRAGLIRVDDRAAAHLLPDRRVRRSGTLDPPL